MLGETDTRLLDGPARYVFSGEQQESWQVGAEGLGMPGNARNRSHSGQQQVKLQSHIFPRGGRREGGKTNSYRFWTQKSEISKYFSLSQGIQASLKVTSVFSRFEGSRVSKSVALPENGLAFQSGSIPLST